MSRSAQMSRLTIHMSYYRKTTVYFRSCWHLSQASPKTSISWSVTFPSVSVSIRLSHSYAETPLKYLKKYSVQPLHWMNSMDWNYYHFECWVQRLLRYKIFKIKWAEWLTTKAANLYVFWIMVYLTDSSAVSWPTSSCLTQLRTLHRYERQRHSHTHL